MTIIFKSMEIGTTRTHQRILRNFGCSIAGFVKSFHCLSNQDLLSCLRGWLDVVQAGFHDIGLYTERSSS